RRRAPMPVRKRYSRSACSGSTGRSVMVPARPVGMPVGQFLARGGTHGKDGAAEVERLPGVGMVAVDLHLVALHRGDGVDAGFARLLAGAFEAHADRNVGGERGARLHALQALVVL